MPVVPRRNPGYIPTESRPVVRPPASAFTAPQPIDASPAIQTLSRVINEEQQKADQTAILSADARLASLSNQLLYDPQTGALNSRGQDAVKAHRDTVDAWQKESSAIEITLSENQRVAFQRVLANRSDDLGRVLAQHSAREVQQSKIDAANANIDAEHTATMQNFATTGDLARVSQGIEHTKNVIWNAGALLGEPPEVTNRNVSKAVSAIHADVLGTMIAKDQDLAASKYFQQHLNELEPDTLLELQKHVGLASLRGESQRRSDSIISSSASLGSALAETRKIEDPQLRDATEQRVHRYFEDKATDERFRRDEAFQRAGQVIEKTHDMNRIAPADFLSLSVNERLQLQHREDELRHPKRVTNPDTYFQLMNSAGLSEATRQQFLRTDLKQYREQLSEGDYQRLLSKQLTMRTAANKPNRKAEELRQAAEVLREKFGITITRSVPGAPMNAPQPSSPSRTATGDINLGLSAPSTGPHDAKLPDLPAAWLARARNNPKYADYLRHMGYNIP